MTDKGDRPFKHMDFTRFRGQITSLNGVPITGMERVWSGMTQAGMVGTWAMGLHIDDGRVPPMKSRHMSLVTLVALTMAVTAACSSTPIASVNVDTPSVFGSAPRITNVIGGDEMALVDVTLTVEDQTPSPKFGLLALPGAWNEAKVNLFSSTANTGVNPAAQSITLLETAFSAPVLGVRSASASFPPLRPAADYKATVFLNNTAGTISTARLAGSDARTGYTLDAGANNLLFTVVVNADEITYRVTPGSSTNSNVVSDNTIVVGDQITLDTGLAASQPGIDHLDIKIAAGAAYPGGALVARLNSPALWYQFVWNTSSNSVGPANYLAASLIGGDLATPKVAQLDFEAYADAAGTVLAGKASKSITVYGKPTVTVQVQ